MRDSKGTIVIYPGEGERGGLWILDVSRQNYLILLEALEFSFDPPLPSPPLPHPLSIGNQFPIVSLFYTPLVTSNYPSALSGNPGIPPKSFELPPVQSVNIDWSVRIFFSRQMRPPLTHKRSHC